MMMDEIERLQSEMLAHYRRTGDRVLEARQQRAIQAGRCAKAVEKLASQPTLRASKERDDVEN